MDGKRDIQNLLVVIMVLLMGSQISVQADEDDWFVYLGNRSLPKAPRKNISAAEALPPLPLPATPLRRTERKKPPQPDYLIGKVAWGQSASFVDSNGDKMKIADWNLCPTDTEKFVGNARAMDLYYHWSNISLNDFHFDPKRLPALLFSGVRTVKLSSDHVKMLREYVLKGGMVICDSIAGSPYFYKSVRQVFKEVFPECRFRVIPPDHPLYHIAVDIEKVNYPNNASSDQPFLEGMYIGSRVGVLVSRYGLGCGWNRNLERLAQLKEAAYYDEKSANEIGINLTAYIVGYAEVGALEGKPEIFALADRKAPTDEFIFAQLRHSGAWNVHPGAATELLMKLRRLTAVRVNLKRVALDAAKDDLSSHPFLYLTGLDDFKLSTQAVSALQKYLHYEGVLLINNGLGLGTFDKAVRRELARILPGAKLEQIAPEHEIYHCLFNIGKVRYSPTLVKNKPELNQQPYLLGVVIGGDLRIIYSPFDLEAGWLEAYYPLIRGYEPIWAQQLGMNIITYIMTH